MSPAELLPPKFSFVGGGPVFHLMVRLGVAGPEGLSIPRRILWFLLIAWLPLVILSIIDGRFLTESPRDSFALDLASHLRFFVGVPLLIIAEAIVGPRLLDAARHLLESGLVKESDHPAFARAIARADARRESVVANFVLLIIAGVGAWTLTSAQMTGAQDAGWNSIIHEGQGGIAAISFAGLWNHLIAVPIAQFLMHRWMWWIIGWALFLFDVSRMDLDLVATHSDEAGGLGFFGFTHVVFAIFPFGICTILSADAAFRVLYEGADLESFRPALIIIVLVAEIIILGPLFVFSPLMARARRKGLFEYGLLVMRYDREFHHKWIDGHVPEGEQMLGNADMQSLADISHSYEVVQSMKLFPFTPRAAIQIAVITILPTIPLILLVVPFAHILEIALSLME